MLADVQSHFGLARPFHGAGNFETKHQRSLVREVCAAVQTGRLVVVSGLVGSGKTHLLRRIEDEPARAGRVAVAKSLAVDKRRTSLPSLIEALFYDLTPGTAARSRFRNSPSAASASCAISCGRASAPSCSSSTRLTTCTTRR